MAYIYKNILVISLIYTALLFLVGCDKEFSLDPDILLGKSKYEVIGLAMALAERTNSNEVNFAAKNKYGHYENYYYVLKLQAEQDERLLKSNEWDVFFTKQKTLLGYHCKFIRIIFVKDLVFKVEIGTLSDS